MHYAGRDLFVSSHHNLVYMSDGSRTVEIPLPNPMLSHVFGYSRLARRALRLDKCNVAPVGEHAVIVRQGVVYHYDSKARELRSTLKLRQCRNVLHQSITVVGDDDVFFGEYGRNKDRGPVPVYRSRDGGRSWATIYEFAAGTIKHVHGCYWDRFDRKLWVLTGDFENECHILIADVDFKNVETIGDGGQTYRACNVFFERDAVHWIMDSQLEPSHHIRFDRATKQITRLDVFPGPVWYIKRLVDGYYLAATAQEIGPGVRDTYSHLMVSSDLKSWDSVHRFEHDGWPKRYFKFGVIGFADGPQASDRFYIFGEAIKGMDGKIARCRLAS